MQQTVAKMTKTAYARHRQVSTAAITYAINEGRLECDSQGLIDAKVWDVKYQPKRMPPKEKDVAAEPEKAVSGNTSYYGEKARRERVMVALAELDLAERQGLMVRRSTVEHEIGGMLIQARDSLVTMCNRLAPLLAAEIDPAKCRLMLLRGISESLACVVDLETRAAGAGKRGIEAAKPRKAAVPATRRTTGGRRVAAGRA